MSIMRAKFRIETIGQFNVKDGKSSWETLELFAVGQDKPYGPNGESEDNTFARYTPNGHLTLTINNPELFGKFKQGQKFYLDFTEAK